MSFSSLIRHRRALVVALAILTCALSVGVPTAAVPDNSLGAWFLQDDPQLKQYHRFHQLFGNDEVILVHVHHPEGVFHHELLLRLQSLSATLEAQQGVQRVHSILSVKDAVQTSDGLAFTRLLADEIPKDPKRLQAAARRAASNPLFVDRLVSADTKQAMLWIQMAVTEDFDNRRDAFVAEVTDAIAKALPDTPYEVGGLGVIYAALNAITQRDFGIFISLTYLLMFALLWWIFRSMRLVMATGGVITVATLVMLGVYGLLDKQMNMVTVLLPTLVIVLGIADAVHFPSSMLHELKQTPADRAAAIKRSLGRILLPCMMTTITTMAGFMALASSPMAVVRDFGIFAALGVAAALLACVVLMPFAFMGLKADTKLPDHPRIQGLLLRAATLLRTRKPVIALSFVALAGISVYSSMKVEADTYTLGYLPDDHPVVTDHHAIVSSWGDYFPVEYTVHPKEGLSPHSPEILNAMETFKRKATALPEVRNGLSLDTLYRRAQDVFAPSTEAHKPFNGPLVSQLQILMGDPANAYTWDKSEPGYRDNIFAHLVTRDEKSARITLVGAMQSASDLGRALAKLELLAAESFGDLATVQATGYTPLYVQIVDYVLKSQTQAFFIALGLIFLLMLLWLRSLRLALISLVVNSLPVGIMLTTMWLMGLDLDIASATIAAIVLGVSIDDTVHFLYHWRQGEQAGKSWDECLDETYQHAGVPAVITTLLLVTGFPVLMLAQVKTVFFFGLLTTIAAVAALLADLLVLPLLLGAWPARAPKSV